MSIESHDLYTRFDGAVIRAIQAAQQIIIDKEQKK